MIEQTVFKVIEQIHPLHLSFRLETRQNDVMWTCVLLGHEAQGETPTVAIYRATEKLQTFLQGMTEK